MTTDLHGLISQMAAELDHCQQLLMDDRRQRHPLADRARAVLAESDGPAVPDGREPASVAEQSIRALLTDLASHMAYMQGQLEAYEYGDPEDYYWYRESVELRQKVTVQLEADQ